MLTCWRRRTWLSFAAYLLAQRYDLARSEFTKALEVDPRLYQARYNLFRLDDEVAIEKTGATLPH